MNCSQRQLVKQELITDQRGVELGRDNSSIAICQGVGVVVTVHVERLIVTLCIYLTTVKMIPSRQKRMEHGGRYLDAYALNQAVRGGKVW